MALSETQLAGALKLFADGTRLRMMGLLQREELSVGELSRSLGMAQSRVSNHLRLLRESGLLGERHEGTSTFLHLVRPNNGLGFAARFWDAIRSDLEGVPEHAADCTRLAQILAERRGEGDIFDRLAGDWDKIGVAFSTGQARQRAAASLIAGQRTFADLGCGTGYFGRALVGLCDRLICVDRSHKMLAQAKEHLAETRSRTRIEFRRGELDRLPIEDAELDGAVAFLVLHHLPDLDGALGEMFRVLKPGASAVVLELAPHRETWMHEELGDRRLGLEERDVVAAFQRSGFTDPSVDPVHDNYRPTAPDGRVVDLPLYLVRACKPGA